MKTSLKKMVVVLAVALLPAPSVWSAQAIPISQQSSILLSRARTLARALSIRKARHSAIIIDTDETLAEVSYSVPDDVAIVGSGGTLTLQGGTTLAINGDIYSATQVFAFDDLDDPGTLTVATSALNPRWFGATGVSGTDDIDALRGMQVTARATPAKRWVFDFPPGHYCYSHNFWPARIPHLTIKGNGSTFECISTDAQSFNFNTIDLSSWMTDRGLAPFQNPGMTHNPGMLIDAATQGERSVTVSTPADMANVSVGDWIMIGGYDQQWGGYPPNLRYYDYRKVEAVDGGTGEVSFGEPLKHSYRTDWQDNTQTVYNAQFLLGKPRLYHLHWDNADDDALINEFIRWENCKFVWNRNQPGANGKDLNVQWAVEYEIIDCDFTEDCQLAIGGCKRVLVKGCEFQNCEADKLTELLHFTRCRATKTHLNTVSTRNIVSGVGIQEMRIDDCEFSANIEVNPRKLSIRDSKIHVGVDSGAVVNHSTGDYTTRHISIENLEATGRLNLTTALVSNLIYEMTVDGVGASNEIKLTDDAAGENEMGRLDVGHRLFKNDGSILAHVTGLAHDGTDFIVETDSSSAWQVGDAVRYFKHQKIEDKGGHAMDGQAHHLIGHPQPGKWFTVTGRALNWADITLRQLGRIKEVYVHLNTAYTGSDPGPLLRIRTRLDAVASQHLQVDLSTTGRRRFSLLSQEMLGSDVYHSATFGVLFDELEIEFLRSGGQLNVVAGEMPDVEIGIFVE